MASPRAAGPVTVRACRVCGCTDDRPCAGGCSWVLDPAGGDVCSACPSGPDTPPRRSGGASIVLVVFGTPAPQGSKRVIVNRHTGKPALAEMSRRVRPWREAVKQAALDVLQPAGSDGAPRPPLNGPLNARMVFTFVRPASHYGTGRNDRARRPAAPRAPATPPDLSKLVRSTEDALTDAGLWADDSRVVEYTRVAKVYAGEDPDALTVAGARIEVWSWTP